MDHRLSGIVLCLVLALGACASGMDPDQAASQPQDGRIYRVSDGAEVSFEGLLVAAKRADFVLIGEIHDNPRHHELQTQLVAALQSEGKSPRAVAFEMVPARRQLDIVEYLGAQGDLAGLGDALDWEESGWPDWAWYQPIAQATVAHDGQIVAAGLSAPEKRAAFDQGEDAFGASFVQRTGLGEAWPPPMMVALQDELRAAHCGLPSGRVVIGMMRVQRAGDAMMADRLAAASGKGGGILIAGNGHVRNDRGVPWYLARLRPEARSVSIGLIELQDDMALPPADPPYDYVWLTAPRADRDDPCETNEEALQRLL